MYTQFLVHMLYILIDMKSYRSFLCKISFSYTQDGKVTYF